MSDSEREAEASVHAIVLDIFPNGRSSDGRAGYDREPLAYALGTRDFRLFEVVFSETPNVAIDDEVPIEPQGDTVKRVREVEFDDLSSGAQSEVEYVVDEMVEADEDRFISFYNDAQPITLRLHQLDLLPGIGEKLRNGIIDERKRRPFEDFADLEDRVDGLHDAEEVIVERILEEFREEDLKYRNFVAE